MRDELAGRVEPRQLALGTGAGGAQAEIGRAVGENRADAGDRDRRVAGTGQDLAHRLQREQDVALLAGGGEDRGVDLEGLALKLVGELRRQMVHIGEVFALDAAGRRHDSDVIGPVRR